MNFKLSGLGVVAVWMKRDRRCCCHCGAENGIDGDAKDGATAAVVINRRGCHRGGRSDSVVVFAAASDGDILDVNKLVNEIL